MRAYSRLFYQRLTEKLAHDIDTQVFINDVAATVAELPQDKLYIQQTKENKPSSDDQDLKFAIVDNLLQKLNDENDDTFRNLVPLENTTTHTKIYSLLNICQIFNIDSSTTRAWLLKHDISPSGYGETKAGKLVEGFDKYAVESIQKNLWQIYRYGK